MRCAVTNIGRKAVSIDSASIHDVVSGAAIPLDVDGCSGRRLEPLRTCQFNTVDGVPGGFALLSFSGSAKRLRGSVAVPGFRTARNVPSRR